MGDARSAASMSMVSPSSFQIRVSLRCPNAGVSTKRLLTVYFKVSSIEDKDSLSSDESEVEVISPTEDASQRRKNQKASFEALLVTNARRCIQLKADFLDLPSGLIPVTRELSPLKIPRYRQLDCSHRKITNRAR